ncbi:DUF6010 family protein [Longimicrobium sp.]|uniref:DUF6010 family protein n=1 Tax=Longimicrobium sp. TaxID=2029185 RepID=UPI003B3B67DC
MQAESPAPARRRAPLLPVLAGFALAAPFLFLFLKHPDGAFDLLALLLAFTGGIYYGAALNGGSRGRVVFEGAFAALLIGFGLLSLFWTPLWMALGFILHGVWDLVHHTGGVGHGVRRWFPPFCAAWDWAIAGMVVFFTLGG